MRHARQPSEWHARPFIVAVAGAGALLGASPASGQVGVAASLFSDDRFRGYSLSDDRPVAILDLTYDAPDGLYGAVSGILVDSHEDGIQPLGLQVNAGYARRLNAGLTLDLGITHARYSRYSKRSEARRYSEAYIGIGGKILSARLSVSPDYLPSHRWSAYGEVNGSLDIGSKFRLDGHIGLIAPITSDEYNESYRREVDWRIGIAKELGRVTLSAAWVGVGREESKASHAVQRHRALVAGLSYAL